MTGGFYADAVKRFFDIVTATFLLLLLLPVMLLVWLTVLCALGSPAFYFDTRAGREGRPIVIGKFRSMSLACGPDGTPLPDADRLGTFGRWLRRSSLDELPQLVSVLIGDMSLVGPRPLPLRYLERYSARQATRLQVRPGLTGWAQIHGRNHLDWPARLEFDARYVEMLGKWYAPVIDMWILVATFFLVAGQVITGRGVTAPGAATMQEFLP